MAWTSPTMSTGDPRAARVDCELEDLILRVNDHPEVRLKLLARAKEALDDREHLDAAGRYDLAERVERWRYQLLNHNAGRMTEDQRELCARLDLLMARIVDGPARSPRGLRAHLERAGSGPRWERAHSALDPGRPLREIEDQARAVTDATFAMPPATGRGMLLYAPLYLSNHCINHCLYCGFRYPNPMEREQLTPDQALAEAEILGSRGFRHLLVVAGEHPRLISVEYLASIVSALAERGFSVAVEVAPQSTCDYRRLGAAGAVGVTLYQETYDPDDYSRYHPRGTKSWYDWRLEGPERAAEAGIARIGLGILLGLGEPRRELMALVAHGEYLEQRFPGLSLAFSLPRIHEAPEGFRPAHPVDDDVFVRAYCALRLAFPRSTLVLSTREPAPLRDRLAGCCITQMSAGSSTAPGGYRDAGSGGEQRQQFPVFDQRPADVVAAMLERQGLRVAWSVSPEAERIESPARCY